MEFISYKGFKIEKTLNGFVLWGKSLFNPIDMKYGHGTLSECKKAARHFLEIHKLKSWPVLYEDRICRY